MPKFAFSPSVSVLLAALSSATACGSSDESPAAGGPAGAGGSTGGPDAGAGAGGVLTGPDGGRTTSAFEEHPCEMALPAGLSQDDVRCGSLEVPQDRDSPDGPTLTVEFAVALAREPAAEPDPLVQIPDGPGQVMLDGYFATDPIDLLAVINRTRDLVFFDPRGVGRSTPDLRCPERNEAATDALLAPGGAAEDKAARLSGMEACHERLIRDGIDLSHFHSQSIASDLAEGLAALGYESYNVWGYSYGARIAQALIRDHGTHVRSVILDAPVMPELFTTESSTVQQALSLVFERCAASPTCAQDHPDVEAHFYSLIDTLNQSPAEVTVDVEGTPTTIYVSGDRFLTGIQVALGTNDFIPLIPQIIDTTFDGDLSILEATAPQVIATSDTFSHGHGASVLCAERAPFWSDADATSSNEGVNPLLVAGIDPVATETDYGQCEFWQVQARPDEAIAPVVSDVPALVLTGAYDPIVSPANGAKAAENLANAQYFNVAGFGYVVLGSNIAADGSTCEQRLLAAFLDDPTTPVDSSCIEAFSDPF